MTCTLSATLTDCGVAQVLLQLARMHRGDPEAMLPSVREQLELGAIRMHLNRLSLHPIEQVVHVDVQDPDPRVISYWWPVRVHLGHFTISVTHKAPGIDTAPHHHKEFPCHLTG